MRIFTLFALVVAIVAVVFASQNATPVLVQFLGWQAQASMALILLLTFALGVVFGLLVSVPPMIGRMRKIAQLKRQVNEQAHNLETTDLKLTEVTARLTAFQTNPPLPHTDMPNQLGGAHEH